MRDLTEQDLIQLKKETYLFEHGFYSKDYREWLNGLKWEQREQLERCCSYSLYSEHNQLIGVIWFKITFPKYFKIGQGKVELQKLLEQGKKLLESDEEK